MADATGAPGGSPWSSAEGRTNRQIAQALYVTVKTVEGHLARAYDKLRISSRGELA